MRAYEGYQVTVAGAVGTVADVDSSNAVRIGDVADDSREVLDFVRYVPGGGNGGQPLDMSTQESSECRDVSCRGLQSACVCDKTRPGRQAPENGGSNVFYQMIPTRHAQESAIGGPARIFPGASVPSTST